MSMVPSSGLELCPVCGDQYPGAYHPCSGPREDRLEQIALRAEARADRFAGAEVVTLPGDDILEAAEGLTRVRRHAPREEGS